MTSATYLDSNWQQGLDEDRRFTWILGSNLIGFILLAGLLQWLTPIVQPTPPQPQPPRIVQLDFTQPPPPPPPPPPPEPKVKPKPAPKPPPKVKPKPKPGAKSPTSPKQAKAGGSVKDPLADMRKLLGGGTPSTPIITSNAPGGQPLVSGSVAGAVGNSTVLTQGIGTGSGGIGKQGHGVGLGSGDGAALAGHGTARVGAATLGDGLGGDGGGGRSSAEISRVFRQHQDAFGQAYRQAVAADAELGGGATLVLRLSIAANGSVATCKVVHSSRPKQALHARICAIVHSMQFSQGIREQTDYTLRLLPV